MKDPKGRWPVSSLPHPSDGTFCTDRRLGRRDFVTALGGGLLLSGGCLVNRSVVGQQKPELPYQFPDTFLWGAGTSGLQHEGSPLADGAGESSMYRWAHTPGKVSTPDWFTPPSETFDVSADFYVRFRSDIQLMRELNLNAYNFEIYWPRVLPEGTGRVNQPGLDFYDRLVDEFLNAGIAPLCNLYVFDHPAALEDRGGWLNRDSADWFADYATVLFDRLGDRVKYWTTICEIPIINGGVFPPVGRDVSATLRAQHHLLLGQGRVVQAFRASRAEGAIGNQHNLKVGKPASNSESGVAAAGRYNAFSTLHLLDSQLRGEYPKELIEAYGARWPADAIREGDLTTISAPIDFVGLNSPGIVTVQDDPRNVGNMLKVRVVGREATGDGLRDALVWVRDRYGSRPIIILEIGTSVEDIVANGKVEDSDRLVYIRDFLIGVHRAIKEGIDLRGVFVWSFLDGWEFGYGLSRRYGLVYVDFQTQERIVKASGHWYRDMIATNGFNLTDEQFRKRP